MPLGSALCIRKDVTRTAGNTLDQPLKWELRSYDSCGMLDHMTANPWRDVNACTGARPVWGIGTRERNAVASGEVVGGRCAGPCRGQAHPSLPANRGGRPCNRNPTRS